MRTVTCYSSPETDTDAQSIAREVLINYRFDESYSWGSPVLSKSRSGDSLYQHPLIEDDHSGTRVPLHERREAELFPCFQRAMRALVHHYENKVVTRAISARGACAELNALPHERGIEGIIDLVERGLGIHLGPVWSYPAAPAQGPGYPPANATAGSLPAMVLSVHPRRHNGNTAPCPECGSIWIQRDFKQTSCNGCLAPA